MKSHFMFLDEILNSINRIEEYLQGVDYDSFCRNQMLLDAVIRNLEIIGEQPKISLKK